MPDKDNLPHTSTTQDTNDSEATGRPSPGQDELTITDEELVILCKERVCAVCTEKSQADDERLRALAEMDNFKKRLTREQESFRAYAAESVLADLLPVLDNLDLAVTHGGNDEACRNILLGVDMTRKVFLDTLKNHGLTPIGQVGEPFDPERHEAVSEEARPDMDPGMVCTLLQRGYVLRDRLLRPARVVVSKDA